MSESSTPETKTSEQLLRESYSAAERRLRLAHPDEFNTLRAEEAKARGLEWAPKKTKEQAAQEQLDAIYADFPDLRPTQVVKGT